MVRAIISSMNPAILGFLLLAADPDPRSVPREEILNAMKACQGYDPTATTNGARFQAEVLLRVARQTPDGSPLRLGHAEWFSAFLERTGLTSDKAPLFARLANEHKQDLQIDYRADRVVESAEGARPAFVANVTLWWPETAGASGAYSYEDLLATPHLEVTNERVIAYRLLEVDGMVVYGEVEGLLGRPTTGILGSLFKLIGSGQVRESRMLVSRDGLQLSRVWARKWAMGVTQTVTVYPDGRMEKDVPPGRPDLNVLAARLEQPLRIRYRPFKPPA
jgi:hypothetical protein